jgi:hypothetical protein
MPASLPDCRQQCGLLPYYVCTLGTRPMPPYADIGLANAGEYLGATFGKHMAIIWAVRANCHACSCRRSLPVAMPVAMPACQHVISDYWASHRDSQGS